MSDDLRVRAFETPRSGFTKWVLNIERRVDGAWQRVPGQGTRYAANRFEVWSTSRKWIKEYRFGLGRLTVQR